MSDSNAEKNKAIVLEAFDTLFNTSGTPLSLDWVPARANSRSLHYATPDFL
jgi:hypothetical protein